MTHTTIKATTFSLTALLFSVSLFSAVFAPGTLLAASNKVSTETEKAISLTFAPLAMVAITPQDILQHQNSQHARPYALQLINHQERWAYILQQIEFGEPAWLDVAVFLRKHSDASITRSLFYALSHALRNAPDNVLPLLENNHRGFSVKTVCCSPLIEEDSYYELGFLQSLKFRLGKSANNSQTKVRCIKQINRQINLLKQKF